MKRLISTAGLILACIGLVGCATDLNEFGHRRYSGGELSGKLVEAVWHGDSGRVKSLLERGANPDAREDNGLFFSTLDIAAYRGDADTLGLLVSHGANIEARNFFGDTPLITAARSAAADCVQLLVDRGADVNAVNQRGETALIAALVQRFVAPHDSKPWNVSPEQKAAVNERVALIVKLLVARGADSSIQTRIGERALDRARAARNESVIQILEQASGMK